MKEPESDTRRKIDHLRELREKAVLGGGKERVDEQHAKGKLTARERIDLLLDSDSFVELDRFAKTPNIVPGVEDRRILGDGVVTGHGTIDGRLVYVFAHDFTVFGGSLGETFAMKVCKVMDQAMKVGVPIIGLNDSEGEAVETGTPLLILEAMKMQNELTSPISGRVKSIHIREGDAVKKDSLLLVVS